jgi:hypothetical protein
VISEKSCRRAENPSHLCLNPEVTATTHLYPRNAPGTPNDGLLEEADLELNGKYFSWSTDEKGKTPANLTRAIHHELGHVLGLGHPCVEKYGNRSGITSKVHSCNELEVTRRLMHPEAALVRSPATLKPDAEDVEELCDLYGRKSLFTC